MRRYKLLNPRSSPETPMQSYNGLVTASPSRRAPATDIDHTPRTFRHYVSVGYTDMQLRNQGTQNKKFTGFRMADVNYLYAVAPTIPGQQRDNYGGFIRRGIDPLSWQSIVDAGPGSQPVHPAGPGKMASDYIHNPYAGGG